MIMMILMKTSERMCNQPTDGVIGRKLHFQPYQKWKKKLWTVFFFLMRQHPYNRPLPSLPHIPPKQRNKYSHPKSVPSHLQHSSASPCLSDLYYLPNKLVLFSRRSLQTWCVEKKDITQALNSSIETHMDAKQEYLSDHPLLPQFISIQIFMDG